MRGGDTVKHRPSGETWVVAYVDGDSLSWFGWPYGEAKIADCELVEACSDSQHVKGLRRLADSYNGTPSYDRRATKAMQDLRGLAVTINDKPTYRHLFETTASDLSAAEAETRRCCKLYEDAMDRELRLRHKETEALFALIDAAFPEPAAA